VALPLLLLIPVSRFGTPLRRAVFLVSATLASLTAVLWWRAAVSPAFEQLAVEGLAEGIDLHANVHNLLVHPLAVLASILPRSFEGALGANLIQQFVGTFGRLFVRLPLPFAYLTIILAVACIESNPKPFTIAERAVLGLSFVLAVVQTYALLFALDGAVNAGHFGFRFAGVQGRYFIPFSIGGLLLLKQGFLNVPSRKLIRPALGAASLYSVLALITMWGFFY